MFGIDICAHAAGLLRFRNDMQRQRGLAGGLRAVDLHYAAARHAADTEGDIETERSGRDHRQILGHAGLAELHDRALAELAFDLADGKSIAFSRFTSISYLLQLVYYSFAEGNYVEPA